MTSAKDPLAEVWRVNHGTANPYVKTAFDPVNRTALLTMPFCNLTVAFTSTNVCLDQPLARYPGLTLVVSSVYILLTAGLSVVVSSASDCTLLTTDCGVSVLWVHSNSSDAYTLQTSLPFGSCGCGCKEVQGGVDGCIVKIYQGCL